MLFSFLVLIGFGTIIFVSTILVISGIVRNRKGSNPRQAVDYYQESYSSTPAHLRPHIVQKPRNFDTLVVDRPQTATPYVNSRRNNTRSLNNRPEQTLRSQNQELRDFNSFIEQRPYTNNSIFSTAVSASPAVVRETPKPRAEAPKQVVNPQYEAPRPAVKPQNGSPKNFDGYIEQKPYANNSFSTYTEPRSADGQLMNYARSLSGSSVNAARLDPKLGEPQTQSYEALNKNYNETKDLMNERIRQYARPIREQKETDDQLVDDFGFSAQNTIPIKSKDDVLRYLDLLKTQSGEKIHYVRTGTLEGPDEFRPIEEYKISIRGEEIANLYFNLNTPFPARRIPQGFTF